MRRALTQEEQSRVFYELCALVLNLLRMPPVPLECSSSSTGRAQVGSRGVRVGSGQRVRVTAAGVASLSLGISFALMLCGSLTFVIGVLLIPWVLGLVMLFYFVGIVSSLSGLGRAILRSGSSHHGSSKEVPGKRFFLMVFVF
ncbi:hypothetical protein AMTRI_Chr06g171660 [Amborella trichopoda]